MLLAICPVFILYIGKVSARKILKLVIFINKKIGRHRSYFFSLNYRNSSSIDIEVIRTAFIIFFMKDILNVKDTKSI